ncbi:MAG: leucine-rich repeat domain-containing protein [Saprospiraceae bacterium]|nr:leucine-rich repeat domain-containing protein [Saprospiraceae bacterium]MBK9044049.1 leucine-rich repeat domain-containing protein [Saprospiraceae bacterium]
MKISGKIKIVFSIIVVVWASYVGNSQNINFPDPIFKLKLTTTNCVDLDGDAGGDVDADSDDDGEISFSEAAEIKRLILENQYISSVEGVEFFTNLEYLWIPFNQLNSLQISSLEKLEVLSCQHNQIRTLELISLPKLKYLYCTHNRISIIKLEDLPELEWLDCSNNEITEVDLSTFSELVTFDCNFNNLNRLTLGPHIHLELLYLDFNQIDSLYLSNLPKLNHLTCSGNNLSYIYLENLPNLDLLISDNNDLVSLDLEKVPNIKWVYSSFNKLDVVRANGCSELVEMVLIENDLKYLFLNTGHILENLVLTFNHNLKYVCAGENQINRMLDILVIYDIFGCEVNSYCTFSSVDQTNLVSGSGLYAESTGDCESNSIPVPYLKFSVEDSFTVKKYFISNKNGSYSIPLSSGKWRIEPAIEQIQSFEITPSLLEVTVMDLDTIFQNFCITPQNPYRQTDITIIPLTPPARPGFDTQYKIIWENKGNLFENGTIYFTYDENIFDFVSAYQNPDAINNGKLLWDYTDLLPFEKREIIVTLNLNSPMENPPVNAGDITYLYANILDNVFRLENVIVGSYDPNDKTCLQGQYFHPDSVGKFVDFLIRFENTGNFAAENVVIKDIIDDKVFDVSSLLITDASHEVYTRIAANKVEFIFENIQLPFEDETNDGYVAFKVKTKSTLILGDSLKNLADIYFDYNLPIRTNETQTTIAIPSSTEDIQQDIAIHPNPVQDILFLGNNSDWKKAEIFDISGRLTKVTGVDGFSVDVSGLESGTYILHLFDKDKRGRVKFVKM